MQEVTATIASKKVFVETWGCQMNVADSEKMLTLLKQENFQMTEKEEEADLFLLNTCHIREKARHKVVSRLGVIQQMKQGRPEIKVAVAGCVAQAEGKKLMKDIPLIDVLIGPGKIDEIGKLLRSNISTGERQLSVGFKKDSDAAEAPEEIHPSLTGKNNVSRFVNIIAGCNNFCAFCVVPFTRGAEISSLPDEVVKTSRLLLRGGTKEIMLLGQNVNSYGLDLVKKGLLKTSEDGPFVDLLRMVASLPELERLRFTTSNPHDFTKSLANLFREEKKLGRYMHLPVQSGSDKILESMKRKVTREEYFERIGWLREAYADMAISTDLIVGFPGETDEDFEATLDLVERVGFSFIFSFSYSPRKNTAAIRFRDQVPEEIKEKRLQKLTEVQNQITDRQVAQEIGQTREVLFAYESQKSPGIYYGKTEHFRNVRVASGYSLVGETHRVKIVEGNRTALVGTLEI